MDRPWGITDRPRELYGSPVEFHGSSVGGSSDFRLPTSDFAARRGAPHYGPPRTAQRNFAGALRGLALRSAALGRCGRSAICA